MCYISFFRYDIVKKIYSFQNVDVFFKLDCVCLFLVLFFMVLFFCKYIFFKKNMYTQEKTIQGEFDVTEKSKEENKGKHIPSRRFCLKALSSKENHTLQKNKYCLSLRETSNEDKYESASKKLPIR